MNKTKYGAQRHNNPKAKCPRKITLHEVEGLRFPSPLYAVSGAGGGVWVSVDPCSLHDVQGLRLPPLVCVILSQNGVVGVPGPSE